MQLSKFENITKEYIVFHEPKEFQLRNTNIKYQRVKIETKLPNGKISPLVLETPFLFSFGVSELKNQETNQLNSYSIPVCLWKKDEKPNQEEKDFYNAISKIHEICRDYLEKNCGDNEAISLGEILKIQKVKQKRRRMNRVLQFFMSN